MLKELKYMQRSTNNPWEVMRPKLKEPGYSDEQIDEMTLAELFELCED